MSRKKSYAYARERFWNSGLRTCSYCECKLTQKTMTVDHVRPLSKGGYDKMSNMVPCCHPCNNAKDDMTEQEFRAKLASGEIDPVRKLANSTRTQERKSATFAAAMAAARARRLGKSQRTEA